MPEDNYHQSINIDVDWFGDDASGELKNDILVLSFCFSFCLFFFTLWLSFYCHSMFIIPPVLFPFLSHVSLSEISYLLSIAFSLVMLFLFGHCQLWAGVLGLAVGARFSRLSQTWFATIIISPLLFFHTISNCVSTRPVFKETEKKQKLRGKDRKEDESDER